MEKIFKLKTLVFIALFVTIFLNIGYSSFSTSLVFSDVIVNIRASIDTRITGISVENASSSVLAEGEEYDVNKILTKVTLPEKTSSITYRIKVTNLGSQPMGIFNISGLPDYLDYSLSNYNLKDKICNIEGKCSLGIVKDDILLTIKYKDQTVNPSIINHNLKLNIEFREVYNITYKGISNNGYQDTIMNGESLKIQFKNTIPYNVVVYVGENKLPYDKYTYENGTLTTSEILGPVTIEYVDKVYLKTLDEGLYFKESNYIAKIKTISFVNYIDIPEDKLATYDLSEESNGSIMGWIDKDYNLYIGSDWKIYSKTLYRAFKDMSAVTAITFNNLNTSEVTIMGGMFYGCTSLLQLDLSSFNTINVTSMADMFYNCHKIISLNLKGWNTSKVQSMRTMFGHCYSLKELDLSSFDTTNVTTMSNMFTNCTSLTKLNLNNFVTPKLTAIDYMFYYCTSLVELDISNLNTSKVTSTERLFAQCTSLKTLDLSNFNTTKVKNMKRMFWNCSSLTALDLSNFDTTNNQNMEWMFYGCKSLISLNLSSFNTVNVTNMNHTFFNCSSLTTLDISNFNTSKVNIMSRMFGDCSSLTELDLSHFDTSNVTNMSNMFDQCISLTKLNISNFNTSQITSFENMFRQCFQLTELDLSSFDTTKAKSMKLMFSGSNKLKTIYVGEKWSTSQVDHSGIANSDQPFYNCSSLVGGAGTTYSSSKIDITYARIDGGPTSTTPGYLTLKTTN